LGLRPELTASIARAAVTRMMGVTFPQRLYYMANVFARPIGDSHSSQQEFYQAGVELLGGSGALADGEILLLVMDCLENLGLGKNQPWQVIVGEAGLTRSLLSIFPEPIRGKVRQAIAHLDLISLEQMPLEPSLRDRAIQMLDLRGNPAEVLKKVSTWDLDEPQRQRVNHLKTLFELLGDSLNQVQAPIILDLSLIRTFDYYTGIVFEVACQQTVVAQGGRYDQLLGVYHPQGESVPGIGFSFQIDQLHPILLAAGQLPQQVASSRWLVAAKAQDAYAKALAYAQTLRQSGTKVEVSLAGEQSQQTIAYAQDRGISQIAWVDAQGQVTTETITR
jgi:ATP phosphoribosyltransferase regulatory subunit